MHDHRTEHVHPQLSRGGGIFVIMLKTDSACTGRVRLRLNADAALRAVLTRTTLQRDSAITEIEIHPDTSIAPGTYDITVYCIRTGEIQELHLQVDVMEWSQYPAAEEIAKREAFLPWLHATHPELGDFPDQDWTRFMTYPQMLIVEHWSFVNRAWELRVCFHVMVAPDDWSMLLLRRRGEALPRFAARRESDGSIREIPVSEYPLHFGY